VGSNADIGVAMTLPFASSENGRRIHAARQAGKHKAIVVVADDRLPADGAAPFNAENLRILLVHRYCRLPINIGQRFKPQ
jgi:hypothetical protein